MTAVSCNKLSAVLSGNVAILSSTQRIDLNTTTIQQGQMLSHMIIRRITLLLLLLYFVSIKALDHSRKHVSHRAIHTLTYTDGCRHYCPCRINEVDDEVVINTIETDDA